MAARLGWLPDWDLSVSGDTVRFANIGSYDPEEVLIFTLGEEPFAVAAADLRNLVWSTHFGGDKTDYVLDICSGADRNLYTTGYTTSDMDFPLSAGIYTEHASYSEVAFIGKIEPFGTRDWVTYYGAGFTHGSGIVTGVRDVYVTGTYTNTNENPGNPAWFPIVDLSGESYVHDIQYGEGPYSYAIIIKLNKSNGAASWSTFYGDDGYDEHGIIANGKDLAINQNGDIYMVGKAIKSDNFPIYRDPSLTIAYQLGTTDETLGFITSFNSQNKLMWSTLFGSGGTSGATDINGVCIGGATEDVFITGSVSSSGYTEFETAAQDGTDQEMQSWGGGNGDAFVAQFDGATYDLLWSTFLGGGGWEIGQSIAYNPVNNRAF